MKIWIVVAAMFVAQTAAAVAQTAPTAAQTGQVVSSTGTWAVVGDVQGVPVILTCSLVEADMKLTGTCTDEMKRPHGLAGTKKDNTVSWSFATDYEGSPITVTMVGVLDEAGVKMAGVIGVDPMGVDGTFSATRQAAATPTAVPSTAS